MRWLNKIWIQLQMLLHREREGQRLDAELQFHLEQQIAENIAAGMTAEEARHAAMRVFGNPALLREQARETWNWAALEFFLQDMRFALRRLWRSPAFALVTLLTLAVGIGANTAIFTLMNDLLLKNLPVASPNEIAQIVLRLDTASAEAQNVPLNLKMIQSLQRRAQSFSGIFGWNETSYSLKEAGAQHTHAAALVSGNAFDVLGIRPAAGRLLSPADDQPGGGPDGWAAVIGHAFWVERYHADPSVVGRHVLLNDHSITIVGVAPKGFEGVIVTARPDFYLPLEYDQALNGDRSLLHQPGSLWLTTMARLRPGVSLKQAAAEVTAVFPGVLDDTLPPQVRHQPVVDHASLVVLPGHAGWSFLRPRYAQPLLLLQMLVGAVLLICCANLAGLGVARASARQHEFALRIALGAARMRMLRQMLMESFLLAVPGAVLGLGFAWAACRLLLRFMTDRNAATSLSTRPDTVVLSVTAGCAVLCALLFGIAPAWIASRAAPEPALRQAARGASRSERGWLRQGFVCIQVALSLTMIVIAGLLSATLVRLYTGNNGFRTENVLFASTDFSGLPQKGAELATLYQRITTRMEEMPGVDAASTTQMTPLSGSFHNADVSVWNGGQKTPGVAKQNAAFNETGPHYFSAMGIRMLAGRDFRSSDAGADICILNRTAAHNLFSSGSAVGSTIRQYQPNMNTGQTATHDCEVIGIVEDAKFRDLRSPSPPTVYFPVDANSEGLSSLTLIVHARSLAEGKDAYRKALHELAPGTSEAEPIPFAVQFDDAIASERLLASLSGFFAALALLLSALGIYGLISWSVTQRTTEIGVRMALGATRMRVFLLVLRQVAGLLIAGVAAGGVAAFFAAHSIRSFLFEVEPGSPSVFVLAALALILIGLLAAMLPARRAVSIDPVEALRTE